MTPDLWMLVASTLLCFAQILIAATAPVLRDMKWSLGNRETQVELDGVAGRAVRAANNMKENLPLFTALVLVAHVSGQADATTALGAQVFFGARVVYAGVYLAGIPVLRTVVWVVSIVGMAMILAGLR